jgi:hypothetical protein
VGGGSRALARVRSDQVQKFSLSRSEVPSGPLPTNCKSIYATHACPAHLIPLFVLDQFAEGRSWQSQGVYLFDRAFEITGGMLQGRAQILQPLLWIGMGFVRYLEGRSVEWVTCAWVGAFQGPDIELQV